MQKAETESSRCITARLDPEFHHEIRLEAAKRDVSMAELVRQALKSEVES